VSELRLIAQTAATKVQETKLPFRLNPMDSRERRIVHLALADDNTIRTESEGEGEYRKVVIYPAAE
jgi:spoIIIJ-associated protein